MSETNQEAVTKFAEVLPKFFFPEGIRPESLRTFLSILKQL